MIVETAYRGHTEATVHDLGREQLDLLMARFGRGR
ncbi:hypothetical protein SAMN05444920_13353 [Nonomuraea solani]|uniref:Uncharacterized protein n=1 Tax=Nonomuraea solani TaxID=1144553 RepID=A0A1H6F1S0_9ACTN|nr:hypothetical protein SAMN05444920_13353 [Nonomuraea solani]